jgi:hypothetical protein
MSDLASAFSRGLNGEPLQAPNAPIAPLGGFPCDVNRAVEEMHSNGALARAAMYEDDELTPAEQELVQEELEQTTFAFMEDAINSPSVHYARKDRVWYS